MIGHVRIVLRRADRRIMGGPAASRTLCGAPVTDKDVLPRDVEGALKASWPLCSTCLALRKAARS